MKVLLLFVVFSFYLKAEAQTPHTIETTRILWHEVNAISKGLTIKFVSTGVNIGGYEGTTLMITNLNEYGLSIQIKVEIIDYCSNSKIRIVIINIPASGTIGGNTWSGGNEQFDYSTPCSTKRNYYKKSYTKIADVKFTILNIKKNRTVNPGSATDIEDSSDHSSQPPDQKENTYNSTGKTSCEPTQIALNGTPNLTCAAILWPCATEYNTATATGDMKKQGKINDTFLVEYRIKGLLQWQEKEITGCPLVHLFLRELEPCTTYEVIVFTKCIGLKSKPSNRLEFSTACTPPSLVKATSVTSVSARISSIFQSTSIPCSTINYIPTRKIEYKAAGSDLWISKYFSNNEDCILNNLLPNTKYVLRMSHRYNNKKYSKNTREIQFKTNE